MVTARIKPRRFLLFHVKKIILVTSRKSLTNSGLKKKLKKVSKRFAKNV